MCTATPHAARPLRPGYSSARRRRPAIPGRWWRSPCGTASSASPARCRRGWPSPLRDRRRRCASVRFRRTLIHSPHQGEGGSRVYRQKGSMLSPGWLPRRPTTGEEDMYAAEIIPLLRHDQIFPFVHPHRSGPGRSPWCNRIGRAPPAHEGQPHVELPALVDRAIDALAVKADLSSFRAKRLSAWCRPRVKRGISTGGTLPTPRTR